MAQEMGSEPKTAETLQTEDNLENQETTDAESQTVAEVQAVEDTPAKEQGGDTEPKPQEAPKKKGSKMIVLLVAALILACAAGGFFYYTKVLPSQGYEKAEALLADGEYDDARKAFSDLGDYKDSADRAIECDYLKAVDLYNKGDYQNAVKLFSSMPEYSDSMTYVYATFKKLAGQNYVDEATQGISHMSDYLTSQSNAAAAYALSFYAGSETEGSWSPDLNDTNLKEALESVSKLNSMKGEVNTVFTRDVRESCNDDTLTTAYEQLGDLHSSVQAMLTTQKAMTYISDMMSGSSSTIANDAAQAESAMRAYSSTLGKMK